MAVVEGCLAYKTVVCKQITVCSRTECSVEWQYVLKPQMARMAPSAQVAVTDN